MDTKLPQDDQAHHAAGQRTHPDRTPVLALIGCGAFAEVFYLPALKRFPDVLSRLILVDKDIDRARQLAERYGAAECSTDYETVLDHLDGAIVAVPHSLHYPISMACIAKGVHVLCEKPLTLSVVEAQDMAAAADRAGVVLATNHTQRLFPANIKVRELIAAGALGKLTYMSYAWGAEFTWPTKSGFYFNQADRRKYGVLVDRGPHALDLVCWWLGAKPELVSSQNDAMGGLDAVAHLKLRSGGCDIDIRLSWLSMLSNSYSIRGSEATIENSFQGWWAVPITYRSGKTETIELPSTEREYNDFAPLVIANFIDGILHGTAPLIPARDVIPSIELIETCYSLATPFDLPWYNMEGVRDAWSG